MNPETPRNDGPRQVHVEESGVNLPPRNVYPPKPPPTPAPPAAPKEK